jgi:hypothetical protein
MCENEFRIQLSKAESISKLMCKKNFKPFSYQNLSLLIHSKYINQITTMWENLISFRDWNTNQEKILFYEVSQNFKWKYRVRDFDFCLNNFVLENCYSMSFNSKETCLFVKMLIGPYFCQEIKANRANNRRLTSILSTY